ncbi:MAG: glycerol-3-phosphate 1-O-acyltransferase PlsY, partial [Stellaceae bacterium]
MSFLVAAAFLGYLLGSIPFGLVLSRIAGHGDIRDIGSGNIGATNVLRTGSKGLAALTLLLDVGKGAAAVAVAQAWSPPAALVAGLCVILGHMFPVWLGFRGGKGVATALGVLLVLAWPVALVAFAVWLAVVAFSRYSSWAALAAAVAGAAAAPFLT